MKKHPIAVIFDTGILNQECFNFSTQKFSTLKSLVKDLQIKLIITDVVYKETKIQISEGIENSLKELSKTRGQQRLLSIFSDF